MSLQGTATKSLALVLLTVFAASFTWNAVAAGNLGIVGPATLVGGVGGLVVALVTIFKPRASPYTAPLYAVLEGLLLGASRRSTTPASRGSRCRRWRSPSACSWPSCSPTAPASCARRRTSGSA
jgi:hypothetical protein